MFGATSTALPTRSGPRPLALALSLALHGVLIGLAAFFPELGPPEKPRSLYEQVIAPQESKLVWYKFQEKLPEVSPAESQRAPRPPGAEVQIPHQTIVANPPHAERGAQLVWRPAPQIKPQPEVPSPNLLAFRPPLIAPPLPGPPKKLFFPPGEVKRGPEPAPALPDPPVIPARMEAKQKLAMLANIALPAVHKPKLRSFAPPVERAQRTAVPAALPEAPGLATTLRSARVPLLAENMAAPLANKPQPRSFLPPPKRSRPAEGPTALPEAPQVPTTLAYGSGTGRTVVLEDTSAAALANRPKRRSFVPPSGGQGPSVSSAAAAPAIEDAPSLGASLPPGPLHVAVVGVNPSDKLTGSLPEASRPARFSAGPEAGGNGGGGGSEGAGTGGGGGTVEGALLSVPGLTIRGGNTPPKGGLLASAAPTSRESLIAAARTASTTPPQEPPSTEIRLAPPPESLFTGRDVYTLAVQMPNITSYTGSWILWFAERQPGPRTTHDLGSPAPLRKVDPKYFPAAMDERIEGKVQLSAVIRPDGRVDQVTLLKGIDPRLDRSAAEALLKWEFEPARRNGTPVEVDVVVEIPFRLAPRAVK